MAETLPIDSSMVDRWTTQWMKQLGFNNDQLMKRSTKVEQFARVRSCHLCRNEKDVCVRLSIFSSSWIEYKQKNRRISRNVNNC